MISNKLKWIQMNQNDFNWFMSINCHEAKKLTCNSHCPSLVGSRRQWEINCDRNLEILKLFQLIKKQQIEITDLFCDWFEKDFSRILKFLVQCTITLIGSFHVLYRTYYFVYQFYSRKMVLVQSSFHTTWASLGIWNGARTRLTRLKWKWTRKLTRTRGHETHQYFFMKHENDGTRKYSVKANKNKKNSNAISKWVWPQCDYMRA